jgi:cob(I)alamin adenosyltransferase
MKIYTKTGDCGTTSLVDGTRVSKACARVEAYGNADELISYLGILRCKLPEIEALRQIQIHLMEISAHLACENKSIKLKNLDSSYYEFLELEIDNMTAKLPPQKSFILPAAPLESAECHVARTICRRCERSVISIGNNLANDSICAIYLNRLSDYLFILARYICYLKDQEEDKWQP